MKCGQVCTTGVSPVKHQHASPALSSLVKAQTHNHKHDILTSPKLLHIASLFIPSSRTSNIMAFVPTVSISRTSFVPSSSALCPRGAARPSLRVRVTPRMGLGEDGLKEDLEVAQSCIDEGCSVDAVQEILTRLERRRGVLALELTRVEEVMAVLARENLGGDRNLVAQAMEAAVSIFSKTDDDYPGVGSATNAWSLDPLKEQPKL